MTKHLDDHELTEALRSIQAPQPPAGAMDRAWEKARLAYVHRDIHAQEKSAGFFSMLFSKRTWLVFATGMATAAILLIVVFPQGQTSVSQLAEYAFHGTDQSGGKDFQKFVSKEQADLKNLQGIFSNRLKAVVRSQDSTQYVLAEEEEKSQPIAEQPVFLEITKNGAKTQITTFSGETVQFDSSDEDSKMEVMLTPEGNVLIVGPNFVWKSDSRQPLKVPGNDGVVKIQAKPLRGI